ncbi:MAG TPA: DJ-1/PfpI family protein [Dissulfurispiraceae bacterium]|nr:DJ-1/PfpI family protein [Dissulfurispiraceae bacterium]
MISIGILIFPQVEELDFVGPFEVLSYVNKIQPESTKVQLVAEALAPVSAFNGMKIIPDLTLQDCPLFDIVIIPGGRGRSYAMKNPAIKEFILRQSKTAHIIASVCTGAFLLAEAGLLTGKKATTYHAAFEELNSYSVKVIKSKVVRDGKIVTAGGVSSGLELGFYLLRELFSPSISQEVANKIEYKINVNTL